MSAHTGSWPSAVEPGWRRQAVAFLVPLVVFVIAIAPVVLAQQRRDFDEHVFMNVGANLVATGLPIDTYTFEGRPYLFFDHTPLYVYFVGLVTAIGGPTVLLLRASSAVFGLLTVALVFLVGLRVRGVGSGLVGAVIVATTPFFLKFSWFVRMEVPLTFFLVLGLYLLILRRHLLAGLSIALAVMLKEIALAFWAVAIAYTFFARGWRAATLVALPAPLALGAWLAYAASLDLDQLVSTLRRWGRSSVGDEPTNRRFQIGVLTWAGTITGMVLGPVLLFAAGAAAALGSVARSPIPRITIVPALYVVGAIAASFVMSLKEPRFLIAVIPMLAIVIALAVDWDAAWARARGRLPSTT